LIIDNVIVLTPSLWWYYHKIVPLTWMQPP